MKHIILASNSPRRRELLAGLDLDFEVKVLPDIDESYPDNLPAAEVAGYISREKAVPYRALIGEGDLVITADINILNAKVFITKTNILIMSTRHNCKL